MERGVSYSFLVHPISESVPAMNAIEVARELIADCSDRFDRERSILHTDSRCRKLSLLE